MSNRAEQVVTIRHAGASTCMPAWLLLLLLGCVFNAGRSHAATIHVAPAIESASPIAGYAGKESVQDGSRERPWRNLSHAAGQLQPGDTLLIAAGTYHEALILPRRAWSVSLPTSIIGQGQVEIRGTEKVSGWQRTSAGLFIKRNWPVEPQQVVHKGQLLTQIGGTIFDGYPQRAGHPLLDLHKNEGGIWPTRNKAGRDNMPANSFFYDAEKKELLVKLRTPDLAPDGIEVATRTWLLRGENVAGMRISKLQFRYANTSTLSRQGAVTVKGDGNLLEQLSVLDADGAGIEIEGNGNVLRDCVVLRAGYLGIKARGMQNLIENNRVQYNNTRGFNKWWEAGGMKFIGERGLVQSRVAGNNVSHNLGDGIWFDWGNDDNLIEKNIVAYNTGFGIHYEASTRGKISDNTVFGNGQRGIYLPHSSDSQVSRNLVVANGLEGLTAIDELRIDPDGLLNLRPMRNQFTQNLVAWNKGLALILPGASYRNQSGGNVFIDSGDGPRFAMGWPKTFNRPMPLAQWKSERGQDTDSVQIRLVMDERLRDALAAKNTDVSFAELRKLLAAHAHDHGARANDNGGVR